MINVVKCNPYLTLGTNKHNKHSLDSLVNQLLNRSIGDIVGNDFIHNQAAANIIESENEFKINIAAPGLAKEDFNIQVEKEIISVSVSKKEENKNPEINQKFTRKEFYYGSFKRSFQLPENIDIQGIAANYESGILYLTLPKKEISTSESVRTISIS